MSQERLTPPPPIKMPKAATRIYDRRPEWKFHANLGLAKNAIAFGSDYIGYKQIARPGEIWVLESKEWVLYYEDDRQTPVDDLPWRK